MREFDPARDLKSPPFALDAAGADWVLATLDRMDEETKLRQLFNLLFIGDDPAEAARLAAGRPGGVTRFVGDDLERAWGCTAALLAGSEIPLLISYEHSPLPILDSTRLLARAAVEVAVGERPMPEWRGGPIG